VFAGFSGGRDQFRMKIRLRINNNRFDVGVGSDVLDIRNSARAKIFGVFFGPRRIMVPNEFDDHILAGFQQVNKPWRVNVSSADEGERDFCFGLSERRRHYAGRKSRGRGGTEKGAAVEWHIMLIS